MARDRFLDLDPTDGSKVNAIPTVLAAAPRPPAPSDAALLLVRAAQANDRGALRELLENVTGTLLGVVRRVLGPDHPAIEDVTQESLMAFVKALPAFRGESNVKTYASRIAVRTALTARRTAAERKKWDDEHELGERPLQPSTVSPEEAAQASRRRELLFDLLDELPESQAETFALRVVLDYSLEEIATVMETPVNTVRSRIRRARETLKARIEADPMLQAALGVA
jgi:RNA polymerase sigma-70 factor (ECF subfamily)